MSRLTYRSRIAGMTYADVLLWIGLLLFIASSGIARLNRVQPQVSARPNVTVYPAADSQR